jgi:hypothetical protein
MLRATALLAALALSACLDSAPSSHSGFQVGMSRSEAFDIACAKMENGQLHLGPVLYVQEVRRPVSPRESICELRTEALAADQWWVIEPGMREKYLVLDFSGDALVALQIKWRGWEP